MKITNLDDEEVDGLVLEEDNFYHAHVSHRRAPCSKFEWHAYFPLFQPTNIASIQDHHLRRQISTRSISDPTLNKHTFFSPIKPPRTYRHDDLDDELVRSVASFSCSHRSLRYADRITAGLQFD